MIYDVNFLDKKVHPFFTNYTLISIPPKAQNIYKEHSSNKVLKIDWKGIFSSVPFWIGL